MQGVIQRGVDMTKGIVLNEGVVYEVMIKREKNRRSSNDRSNKKSSIKTSSNYRYLLVAFEARKSMSLP